MDFDIEVFKHLDYKEQIKCISGMLDKYPKEVLKYFIADTLVLSLSINDPKSFVEILKIIERVFI